MRGQRHAPAALYPRERPGTHCTGDWVGPRVGLDRCGKSRPPPGFDPRTVQPIASRYTDYATLIVLDSSQFILLLSSPICTWSLFRECIITKHSAHSSFIPKLKWQSDYYFRTCIRATKSCSPIRQVCSSRDTQISCTAALDQNSSEQPNRPTSEAPQQTDFLNQISGFHSYSPHKKKVIKSIPYKYLRGILNSIVISRKYCPTTNTHAWKNTHSVERVDAQRSASHVIYR